MCAISCDDICILVFAFRSKSQSTRILCNSSCCDRNNFDYSREYGNKSSLSHSNSNVSIHVFNTKACYKSNWHYFLANIKESWRDDNTGLVELHTCHTCFCICLLLWHWTENFGRIHFSWLDCLHYCCSIVAADTKSQTIDDEELECYCSATIVLSQPLVSEFCWYIPLQCGF